MPLGMDRPGGLSYRSNNGSEFPGIDLQRWVVFLGNKGLYCLRGGLVTSETLTSYCIGCAVSGLPGSAGGGTERSAGRNGKGRATVDDAERCHHPDQYGNRSQPVNQDGQRRKLRVPGGQARELYP